MKNGIIGKLGMVFGMIALSGAGLKQAHAIAIPIKQDQILVEYLDAQDKPLSKIHGYSLEWIGFGAGFPIGNRAAEHTEELKLPGHGTATVHLKMESQQFEISFEGKSGTLLKKESCEVIQVIDYIPNFENTTFYCGAENSEHAFKVRITNVTARERQIMAKAGGPRISYQPQEQSDQQEKPIQPETAGQASSSAADSSNTASGQ